MSVIVVKNMLLGTTTTSLTENDSGMIDTSLTTDWLGQNKIIPIFNRN